MSDTVDETPEEFVYPGPEVWGNQVTIRIGSRDFLFEKTEHGTLIYLSNSPAVILDDEDDKPFDPSEYR